jgi:alpha-L-fucosidase
MILQEKKQLFADWGYGMFIHYGIYSILGRGEWVMFKERMKNEDYFKFAPEFKPKRGCAREWAALAQRAGMKYMVLTTRHHDGFFLGSKLLHEYCDACREYGLGVGFYYSVMDWSDSNFKKGPYAPEWTGFVGKTHRQIKELMTDYGNVDYLFYDGCPPAEHWNAKGLHAELRKLQPSLLISCRCHLDEDVYSFEGHSGAYPGKTWESCYTLNNSWGYNKYDRNWKTPETVIDLLTSLRHNGGNLLLNIGPLPDGSVLLEDAVILETIGKWLEKNGESIYDVKPYPFDYMDQEISTGRGNTVYIRLNNDCRGPERMITGIGNKVLKMTMLTGGEEIAFKQDCDKITLTGLSFRQEEELPRVLKLELDGAPRGIRNPMMPDLSIRIN